MQQPIEEMGTREGFHGYGPEQGYGWLREAIARHDFQARGCEIERRGDLRLRRLQVRQRNILDILGAGNRIAVTDPVYPVYVDSNVMAGRTGDADDAGRYGASPTCRSRRRTASCPPARASRWT
jgi:LL-diaminopimelate aminotransferase